MLSIGIPTYNRAALLRSALNSIAPQVAAFGSKVELVVSDNASTDNTRAVVEAARKICPITYRRNDENLGPCKNIRAVTNDLSTGTFGWVLGDDEMLRPGAVAAVVRILESNSDVDCVYVNYSLDFFAKREGRDVTPDDFKEFTRTADVNLAERRVATWEEMIEHDFNGLTPIYCTIFRREGWVDDFALLIFTETFANLQNTYPHSYVNARRFRGKPIIATGYPWVIMCGKESWTEQLPVVVLERFHQLLDYYESLGVAPRNVEEHRRRIVGLSGTYLALALGAQPPKGLEEFSFLAYCQKYWRFAELRREVGSALRKVPLGEILKRHPILGILSLALKATSKVSGSR